MIANMLLAYGDLTLDTDSGDFSCGPRETHLGPQQVRMMELMFHANGRTVTRNHLLNALWRGADDGPEAKSIDVAVHRLRRKLGGLDATTAIETKWGFGYRLLERR